MGSGKKARLETKRGAAPNIHNFFRQARDSASDNDKQKFKISFYFCIT